MRRDPRARGGGALLHLALSPPRGGGGRAATHFAAPERTRRPAGGDADPEPVSRHGEVAGRGGGDFHATEGTFAAARRVLPAVCRRGDDGLVTRPRREPAFRGGRFCPRLDQSRAPPLRGDPAASTSRSKRSFPRRSRNGLPVRFASTSAAPRRDERRPPRCAPSRGGDLHRQDEQHPLSREPSPAAGRSSQPERPDRHRRPDREVGAAERGGRPAVRDRRASPGQRLPRARDAGDPGGHRTRGLGRSGASKSTR